MKTKSHKNLRSTRCRILLILVALLYVAQLYRWASADTSQAFVRVSPRDPRYFELSDASPYIPIGLNLIAPQHDKDGKLGLSQMEQWMKRLSENRGNFIRVWLSHLFWDVEHAKSGRYDAEKAKRIDELLKLARRYNVRVKITLEHFRSLEGNRWFAKSLHHVSQGGPAESITDFFTGRKSRKQFKRKLNWYAQRYGSDPIVFAWELWNEINCVHGQGWDTWTEEMLAELHRLFPKNLATQSLGSFDNSGKRKLYHRVTSMQHNQVAQVHRYLDLGASLKVCHGPVDVLAADAIRELQAVELPKPILLAESGAVEPGHSGPFKLYDKDKAGIILHDVLFAPFFVGAAGPGQIWHWDRYVDRNNLWHHYARFAEVVKDIDVPAENFEPIQLKDPRLRVYALKGKRIFLIWCRDINNTWHSELQNEQPPPTVRHATLNLRKLADPLQKAKVRIYDPWTDRWSTTQGTDAGIMLPDFARSLVVRIEYNRNP